jgi:hypothetical protein
MTHKALEQYFHTIVNTTPKELTMFENTKMFFTQFTEKINSLLTKPTAFVEEDPALHEDGYWAFEMFTPDYVCDGELQLKQHDLLIEPSDTTWMEALDQILDIMGKHYGDSIKEQVYYSVEYPLNYKDPETGKPYAGYGRCLNDNLFQQLLLAYPEVYESQMFGKPTKDLFA